MLSSGTITCTIATLASGAPVTFPFAVINLEPRGGSLHDSAKASSATADPNLANNTAAITIKVS